MVRSDKACAGQAGTKHPPLKQHIRLARRACIIVQGMLARDRWGRRVFEMGSRYYRDSSRQLPVCVLYKLHRARSRR